MRSAPPVQLVCVELTGRNCDRQARGRMAFSLIELLAAIGVMVILAAILITAVGAIRNRANTSTCLSNLRMWHGATLLYAVDNNNRLPYTQWDSSNGSRDGFKEIYTYLGSGHKYGYDMSRAPEYYCPVGAYDEKQDGLPYWRAYGFNAFISEANLGEINNPTRQVWMMDMPDNKRWIGYTIIVSGNDAALKTAAPRPHGGQLNFVYLDGHAVTKKLSEVSVADFTRGAPASYRLRQETTMVGDPAYDK